MSSLTGVAEEIRMSSLTGVPKVPTLGGGTRETLRKSQGVCEKLARIAGIPSVRGGIPEFAKINQGACHNSLQCWSFNPEG